MYQILINENNEVLLLIEVLNGQPENAFAEYDRAAQRLKIVKNAESSRSYPLVNREAAAVLAEQTQIWIQEVKNNLATGSAYCAKLNIR